MGFIGKVARSLASNVGAAAREVANGQKLTATRFRLAEAEAKLARLEKEGGWSPQAKSDRQALKLQIGVLKAEIARLTAELKEGPAYKAAQYQRDLIRNIK